MARTQEFRKWANNKREQRNRRVNRSHVPCQRKQCAIHGGILDQQFRGRKIEVNVHVKRLHQNPAKRQNGWRLRAYVIVGHNIWRSISEGSAMTTQDTAPSLWMKLPISLRAIISGLLIALVAANVWLLLLPNLGVPLAAIGEAIFLALYVWWAGGGGPQARRERPEPRRFAEARCHPGNGFGPLSPVLLRCYCACFDCFVVSVCLLSDGDVPAGL